MNTAKTRMTVRSITPETAIIDVYGDINAAAEAPLMEAYNTATAQGGNTLLLNFTGLDYMNSTGIGLLVTLLIRASRQKQRLMAYGLSDHYRQVFELTRLNEAVSIFNDEQDALFAAANGLGRS